MNLKTIGALALAAMVVAPAIGDDEAAPKKGKRNANRARQNVATMLIKQLEPVGLSEEQTAKIKELGQKATKEMKSIREAAGITPELQKKRVEIQKSMKDSELKRKELVAAINEKAGFSEAHSEALVKANAVRTKFRKEVIATLSDEQKEKLPAALKGLANARERGKNAKRGQGKKKKDAA
jgi:hypothetical protein